MDLFTFWLLSFWLLDFGFWVFMACLIRGGGEERGGCVDGYIDGWVDG